MTPRSSYHHGDLRRALVEAAERLVVRDGPTGASLRAIAREAGVSAAAPYHHFTDRETLLAEVAARGFGALETTMGEAARAAGDQSPLERLRAAGSAYVSFAADNPEIYRLMFSGMLSDRGRFPDLKDAADSAFGLLQRLMGGGKDAGGGDGSPPPEVALAAWSLVHGLAFLALEGLLEPEREELGGMEEVTRRVTTVLGRGLKDYVQRSPGEATSP